MYSKGTKDEQQRYNRSTTEALHRTEITCYHVFFIHHSIHALIHHICNIGYFILIDGNSQIKTNFGQNIFSMQLFTLIRSYVQMCKRCITPSYDSLFAQKLESHITHVFVYSLQLQEIAFKKFSLQSRFIELGSYFCQLSIL